MLYTQRTRRYTDRRGSGAVLPPFYSDLTFYSKERIDEFVKNKLDETGGSDGEIVGRKYAKYNNSYTGDTKNLPDDNWTMCIDMIAKNTQAGIISNKISGSSSNGINIVTDSGRIRIYVKPLNETSIYVVSSPIIYTDNDRLMIYISYDRTTTTLLAYIYNYNTDTLNTYTNSINLDYFTNKLQIGRFYYDYNLLSFNGYINSIKVWGSTIEYSNEECSTFPDIMYVNHASGDTDYVYELVSGEQYLILGNSLTIEDDLTQIPYNAVNGMSIIDGVDGEVPAKLGTQVDALNGDPLTNPATSKIVSNVDGYIILPDDIKITVDIEGTPTEVGIFDRSNPYLYTNDARNVLDYLGVGYEYYWRIDKLNTANVLSWMQPDYKFSWFVKNTFAEGTYDPITIKEIIAYNAPITGAGNLSKMMKYLGLNIWYDSQTWDDDEIWID